MNRFHAQRTLCIFLISVLISWSLKARAQDLETSPGKSELNSSALIDQFAQLWDESAWENEFRTTPEKYMRIKSDKDWQMRMHTLQQLVQRGEASVDPLLSAVGSDEMPVRVLAAQALGFLGDRRALERLLEVGQTDAHPTVRLYAIDSYGMLGGASDKLRPLLQTEKNRDVKMHINYALERDGELLDPRVIDTLKKWDSSRMATAVIGEPAPAFDLETAQGGRINLADFKGKSAVVLVFIYGDT